MMRSLESRIVATAFVLQAVSNKAVETTPSVEVRETTGSRGGMMRGAIREGQSKRKEADSG